MASLKLKDSFRCNQFGVIDGHDVELIGSKLVKGWGRLYKVRFFDEEDHTRSWVEFLPHNYIAKWPGFITLCGSKTTGDQCKKESV